MPTRHRLTMRNGTHDGPIIAMMENGDPIRLAQISIHFVLFELPNKKGNIKGIRSCRSRRLVIKSSFLEYEKDFGPNSWNNLANWFFRKFLLLVLYTCLRPHAPKRCCSYVTISSLRYTVTSNSFNSIDLRMCISELVHNSRLHCHEYPDKSNQIIYFPWKW